MVCGPDDGVCERATRSSVRKSTSAGALGEHAQSDDVCADRGGRRKPAHGGRRRGTRHRLRHQRARPELVDAGGSQVVFVDAVSIATNSATTLAITLTAPAASGDLALVAVAHRGGSTGTISALSAGWTAVAAQQNATTVLGTRLFWKMLGAGDIGVASTFAFNTPAAVKGAIVALVARGQNIAIVASAHQTNSAQANIPIPGLTLAAGGGLLVALASKAHDAAHTAVANWTLDAGATIASAGGSAATRNRLSGQYQTFSGSNPPGLTVVSTTSAVSTGHQIALSASAGVSAERGTLLLTGAAATLEVERLVTALASAYATTGVLEFVGVLEPVGADSLTLTGTAATFAVQSVLSALPGALTTAGQAATLEFLGSYAVSADPSAYALTGVLVIPAAHFPGVPTPASAVITGRLATMAVGLTAEPSSYQATGVETQLPTGGAIPALRGTFTLVGVTAVVRFGSPELVGALTLTGPEATVVTRAHLIAESSTYGLTGVAAGLESAGGFTLTADPAALVLTGGVTSAASGHAVQCGAGADGLDRARDHDGALDLRRATGGRLRPDRRNHHDHGASGHRAARDTDHDGQSSPVRSARCS